MATLQSRFIRCATIFMALTVLVANFFWDGWSFSGSLFRYSAWLQPSVFMLCLVALLYCATRPLQMADSSSAASISRGQLQPIEIQVEAEVPALLNSTSDSYPYRSVQNLPR